jgi:hypothetical protein
MNTKVENKVTILSNTLTEFFGDKMNLARIKFFGLFISALCKVQTVCFEKLACSFDSDAKMDSSFTQDTAVYGRICSGYRPGSQICILPAAT